MLQLIIKDFRANWMYQLFSLVILFSTSTLFIYLMLKENGNADPELVIYFMVVMLSSSIVSLLFMKIDEVHHTDEIFASLPVTRSQIVLAKYSTSFIQISLALVAHFLGAQFGAYMEGSMNYPELEIIYKPMLWLSILIALLFFKSYAYPLYFKFGLTKGAVIHSVIQFCFFAIFVTIMINYNNAWADFQHGLKWVVNQNKLEVLAIFTAFFLLIMGGSMVLSTNFFKNKDI
ncbi:MAG: ABC-2 transporter permease [Flavobacteriaceae bacterium]|nr:ABC-2 transporter permease [Flavobacteriaceae bacterium]